MLEFIKVSDPRIIDLRQDDLAYKISEDKYYKIKIQDDKYKVEIEFYNIKTDKIVFNLAELDKYYTCLEGFVLIRQIDRQSMVEMFDKIKL